MCKLLFAWSKTNLKGLKMLHGIENVPDLNEKQVEALNELAKGMLNKNQELLKKIESNKEKVNEGESAAERLRALEMKLEREQAESKENYQKALQLKEEEYLATVEKYKAENEQLKQRDRFHTVDSVLKTELIKLNVNPDLLDLVSAQISNSAEVVEGQAVVGDKSLSDYLKEWADTPQGKAVTLAPQNSGTGSNGTLGAPKKNAVWADYSTAELSAIRQNSPDEYARLKETR